MDQLFWSQAQIGLAGAALAIVSTTLTEGAKCNKPIGNLVAAGGAGPAVGVPGEHDAHHWRSEIWGSACRRGKPLLLSAQSKGTPL